MQTNLISSRPAACPRFPTSSPPPPPGRPLCYSCPAFLVDVKDNPPTNTALLSLIPSRYAAEVEIYGPFFCYPEHKSCIRIKVTSLSSLSNVFFPTPDSIDICRKISQTDNNYNISPTPPQPYNDILTVPVCFYVAILY